MDRDQQSSEMETLDLLWFDLKKKYWETKDYKQSLLIFQ